MIPITLNPLELWRYLKNKVKIQEVWLEYAGAEIDERRKKLVVAFDLLFRIINTSDKEAEKVRWAVSVRDPVPKIAGYKEVHTKHSIPITLITEGTFNPLIIFTDFSTVDIYDDPLQFISAPLLPLSEDVSITIRVTSATHRGDKQTVSVVKLLKEWIERNYGKTLAELEEGFMTARRRKLPPKEQLKIKIGEDLNIKC